MCFVYFQRLGRFWGCYRLFPLGFFSAFTLQPLWFQRVSGSPPVSFNPISQTPQRLERINVWFRVKDLPNFLVLFQFFRFQWLWFLWFDFYLLKRFLLFLEIFGLEINWQIVIEVWLRNLELRCSFLIEVLWLFRLKFVLENGQVMVKRVERGVVVLKVVTIYEFWWTVCRHSRHFLDRLRTLFWPNLKLIEMRVRLFSPGSQNLNV